MENKIWPGNNEKFGLVNSLFIIKCIIPFLLGLFREFEELGRFIPKN